MKLMSTFITLIKAMLVVTIPSILMAQVYEEEQADKTLGPYFFVKSDDPNVDQLPLKATYGDVNISGVIADVRVTQIYKNEGKNPLEAIYIFPASTRAAVYSMKMTIGERTIVAKIAEREKAREEYEQAKEEGKSASLLEQQRPNVFQMNVANIMPGDEIKVELSYTELLIPTDAVYEFVYPTVVGPRYSNKSESEALDNEKWVKNPYLHEGKAAPYEFDLQVRLLAGMPIQDLTCSSHQVDVHYDNKSEAQINLAASEKSGGNRDFILKYRLAGKNINSGLLLYSGKDENFFLTIMQPPERVRDAQIPPREYIFIVDVSGSMYGFPLDISKKLLRDLISNLKKEDKFNVLLFAGGSRVMSDQSVAATEANVHKAIQMIESERGGGGTELLPALKRALALPRSEEYSRNIVIVSDGYVSVEKEAFDLIRTNLGNANLFAFGIGTSVNRYLIEGMARIGMGEAFVVTAESEAALKADKFREYILSPVLTQIRVKFENFETYDVEPISVPDVLAQRPVIVYGKWRGQVAGEVRLKGYTGKGKEYTSKIPVSEVKPSENNAALRYLWARSRIALLADYNRISHNDERIKEITNIGLKYNLLTDYTSFVAIDSEIRNKDGKLATINQPLPLPQGVSDYAVSGRAGGLVSMMQSAKLAKSPRAFETTLSKEDVAEEEALPPEQVVYKPVTIKLDKVHVDRSDKENDIKRFIEKKLHDLDECIDNKMHAHLTQNEQAKIVIEMEIGKDGNVTNVEIKSNDCGDKNIERCIIKKLKKWQLAFLEEVNTITVTYTLIFAK
jgi:Ca-activated chloride channel family protein